MVFAFIFMFFSLAKVLDSLVGLVSEPMAEAKIFTRSSRIRESFCTLFLSTTSFR